MPEHPLSSLPRARTGNAPSAGEPVTGRHKEASPVAADLTARGLTVGYGGRDVFSELDLEVPTGGFTVIIGPNGCGKSTLLRSLSRMIRPGSGSVLLGGRDLAGLRTKQIARSVGTLAQAPTTPAAITVADLVARGRNPHQTLLRQWSRDDERAVDAALLEVGMNEHADRLVEELSGGQRQRVWIAMALAQETPFLLLDEPTTYLDVAHQIDVLDLCSRLHEAGRTLVAVLHDLNLASRYASHIVAMHEGRIVAQGSPDEVITPGLLREVFDLEARIILDPETGRPLVIPRDRRTAGAAAADASAAAPLRTAPGASAAARSQIPHASASSPSSSSPTVAASAPAAEKEHV